MKKQMTDEELARALTIDISENFRRIEKKMLDTKTIKDIERRINKNG